MSGQPPGASFIPFMTSVTTDIYERIEKISQAFNEVKSLVQELLENVKGSMGNVLKGIEELIEQGEMNKDMTLQAFADTTNNLINQIKIIRNEQVKSFQSEETRQLIGVATQTANVLETRLADIQTAILINGIHAIITGIKAGRVVGIPVPMRGVTAPGATQDPAPKPDLAAPVPSLSSQGGTEKPKKSYFGKGVRKKTHDEIMEEKRKKDKLFGRYLK
ncbi:MAG: hypothetical protein ACTSQI_06390 [Candidatus Helarchaeota archaeon]